MRLMSSLLTPFKPFLSWTAQTAPARFCSNSSSDSPMHNIHPIPSSNNFVTWPLMYSSVSPKMTRRSLCPASAHWTPTDFNIVADTAPVNAPWTSGTTPSAPISNLPPTDDMAVSMKTYGTNNATSASGESGPIEAAISDAKATASSFVWGFNFQFPLMNGFLAMSKAVVAVDDMRRKLFPPLIENADAVEAVRARRESAWNFMVFVVGMFLVGTMVVLDANLVGCWIGKD
mmetsp:Transcript_48987/g.118650  ORF Transcript_48987/g.118650 Transcript_48987/m.118650 type:complete len:231 (+) Transcript_48987:419-1111(+)